jgi:hypothetical protein
MSDKGDLLDFVRRNPTLEALTGRGPQEAAKATDDHEEDFCAAFGFLRGVRDRALALEFRYLDGNSDWHAYNCLTSWRFNPSVGLLLKFTGDLVTLVLIRGSNLDALVNDSVDLPHGIQRHRIMWVREMDKAETKKIGTAGPTIDRIEVAEFESQEELREWLAKTAPVFARQQTA